MPLNLNDLMKKAKDKGLIHENPTLPSPAQLLRPWQQESVLFVDDKTVNKVETNRKQSVIETVNKVETNSNQTVNNIDAIEKTVNKSVRTTVNKTVNKPLTNRKQSVNTYPFSSVIGLQREILIFIFESCKSNRSDVTEAITLEHISFYLDTTVKTIKTTIQRLVEKDCLVRVESKNGRGGWSKYSLSQSIYQEILQAETVNKPLTNRKQSVSTTVSTSVNSAPSSSSLNINKTTTELSEEWNFDISDYAKFGFTKTHLKQLAPLGIISASDIESSLIEFNYDFENNSLPPIRTGKINLLMGLFRRGQRYVSDGYLNEQEALIKEMAERAERKRKTQQEEAFMVWQSQLTEEELKTIFEKLPISLMVINKTYGKNHTQIKQWLFNHYLSKCST